MNCTAKTECDMLHIDANALKTVQGEAISSMNTSTSDTRICRSCQQDLPIGDFKTKGDAKSKGGGKYRQTTCRTCSNRDYNAWVTLRRIALRTAVYEGYGNQCACCGETEHKFLSIDHVNNDGNKDRAIWRNGVSYTMYRQIIREGFPKRFQLLCYNCNVGKHRNKGICPHQDSCSTAIPSGSTLQANGRGSAFLLPITYGC